KRQNGFDRHLAHIQGLSPGANLCMFVNDHNQSESSRKRRYSHVSGRDVEYILSTGGGGVQDSLSQFLLVTCSGRSGPLKVGTSPRRMVYPKKAVGVPWSASIRLPESPVGRPPAGVCSRRSTKLPSGNLLPAG